MHSDIPDDLTALAAAARTGDLEARDALLAAALPLVYNIVGRALSGHADVDDVVQETLLRVVGRLGDLRDPASFRSWLVAIAMNRVRDRAAQRQQDFARLDEAAEVPDPRADFVGLTILRLGLSGQRREVAEATRWLDEEDRSLLALWWLEATGDLSRTELTDALGLGAQHTAVRVQRMKAQLEGARLVVRALAAEPRCVELTTVLATWDGQPSGLWRKRTARHVRDCESCSSYGKGLVPAERLLAGLPLLVPPSRREPVSGGMNPGLVGAAVVVVLAVLGLLFLWPDGGEGPQAVAPAPSSLVETPAVSPPSVVSEAPSPIRSSPGPSPIRSVVSPPSVEAQVLNLINTQRTKAGCKPVRSDPKLHTAAQRHAQDMAARGFFDHTGPDGKSPGDRLTAAGYRWSAWAENLFKGPKAAPTVVDGWMDSSVHRQNMLTCRFTQAGVGSSGSQWVLVLAAG